MVVPGTLDIFTGLGVLVSGLFVGVAVASYVSAELEETEEELPTSRSIMKSSLILKNGS